MIILNFLLKIFGLRFVTVGAAAIITNSRGEILLGKRSKNHPFYPGLWCLPGGIIEFGETLEQAIKREVKEEIGVKIKIIKNSKKVYEYLPIKGKYSKKKFKMHGYTLAIKCKMISGKPKPLDETSEVKWFKPSEIKKMKLAYNHNKILVEEGLVK